MKELMLPVVALATLCLSSCEQTKRADRTDVNDAAEPGPAGNQVRGPNDATAREVAEQGGRNPEYSPNTPGGVDSLRHTDENPAQPGQTAKGSQARTDFVAASRRRLDDLERELQQLETRSRERGKQLRSEIREEKRRLDRELESMDTKSEEAWSQMKDGFADALERLEGQIRQVRKDIDPDA